jgi:hypothetical protein
LTKDMMHQLSDKNQVKGHDNIIDGQIA